MLFDEIWLRTADPAFEDGQLLDETDTDSSSWASDSAVSHELLIHLVSPTGRRVPPRRCQE